MQAALLEVGSNIAQWTLFSVLVHACDVSTVFAGVLISALIF